MHIVIRPRFIIALTEWRRCWGEVNNIFRWCDSRRIYSSPLEEELWLIWAVKVWRRILDRALCGRFRRLLRVTTGRSAGRSVLGQRLGPSRCARGLVSRRGSERSPRAALRRGVWWEERQGAS